MIREGCVCVCGTAPFELPNRLAARSPRRSRMIGHRALGAEGAMRNGGGSDHSAPRGVFHMVCLTFDVLAAHLEVKSPWWEPRVL